MVGCGAVGCFGDRDPGDAGVGGEGSIEAGGELVGDVLGDQLGGGVDRVEGGEGIEVVVGKWGGYFVELVFGGVEIAEEPVGVEGVADDAGGDAPVVPVDGFLVPEDGDGMGGAELGLDSDFKHLWVLVSLWV